MGHPPNSRRQQERKDRIMESAERALEPVPTLRELFQMTDWVWAYCTNGNQGNCYHQTALRLQPFADRWGWNASSDLLRERLVCKKCGGKGAQIVLPSRDGLGRMKPFPIA
jgi:hypothetical protein